MFLYTDGSTCPKNPGTGGASFIAVGKEMDFISGWCLGENITNNRAEAEAVYGALMFCVEKRIKTVDIFTDSNYVEFGITKIKRSKYTKTLKTNMETWDKIANVIPLFKLDVNTHHVESHAGNMYNEIADTVAFLAANHLERNLFITKELISEYRKTLKKEKATRRKEA